MRIIAKNRKAYHDYEILEKFEAGIELVGSEVKSVRAGKINLAESYAQCQEGEIFVNRMHISPYEHSGMYTPDPARKRKLLLHRKQVIYLSAEIDRKRLTLIPLSVYFKKQWVKVELGLCRGRKKFDKRQAIASRESKRRVEVLLKNRR